MGGVRSNIDSTSQAASTIAVDGSLVAGRKKKNVINIVYGGRLPVQRLDAALHSGRCPQTLGKHRERV